MNLRFEPFDKAEQIAKLDLQESRCFDIVSEMAAIAVGGSAGAFSLLLPDLHRVVGRYNMGADIVPMAKRFALDHKDYFIAGIAEDQQDHPLVNGTAGQWKAVVYLPIDIMDMPVGQIVVGFEEPLDALSPERVNKLMAVQDFGHDLFRFRLNMKGVLNEIATMA